jgi:hypothetical protein
MNNSVTDFFYCSIACLIPCAFYFTQLHCSRLEEEVTTTIDG